MLSHTRSPPVSRISGKSGSVTVSRAMRSEAGNMLSRNPLLRKSVVRWIASYETPVPMPSLCIASMNALRLLRSACSGSSTVNMFQLCPGLLRGGRRSGGRRSEAAGHPEEWGPARGREQVVAREALEVVAREALARTAPFVQVRELLQAQPRRHVGEVVLDPRALH